MQSYHLILKMLNLSKNSDIQMEDRPLHSMKIMGTPQSGRVLARWVGGILIVMFFAMFLPWQQNIRGTGEVTTFNPANRPQTVETAIAGRIEDWMVREGDMVSKGDTILVISEIKDKFFDPNLVNRLGEQVQAKENSFTSKEDKVEALRDQISALEQEFALKLEQAKNKVEQTRLKVISDSMDFQAEITNFTIAEQQYQRQERLYEQGLKSLTELEARGLKLQESTAKKVSAETKLLASRQEYQNALLELTRLKAEFQEKKSKTRSDLNATLADMYETEGQVSKLKNELTNMEIRNQQYIIRAPQDGYVMRALKAGIGQTIKEGEAVATIMPVNPDLAVEMFVRAMDVPLLYEGAPVRIEFDGWPALVFSGWPGLNVGTFGGKVAMIDYANSVNGLFRVLVIPDEEWPEQLRQGSGAYGWVMLNEVPVWWEFWRQLNGFPPDLVKEAKKEGGKSKK